jgi:hypothetical protein
MKLEAIETLALDKAANGSAKPARAAVKPGEYPVNFLAHIVGTVKVGEDHDTKPTASIPFKKALAALAHVAGCTGAAGVKKIERAMRIALETDADAGEVLAEIMPQVERIEASIIEPMLAKLPKKPVKGSVTSKLTVTKAAVSVQAA